MKQIIFNKTVFGIVMLMILAPVLGMAQPAGPGDGQDPFATPVNGYVAFVAVIAFIYGAYRIYQLGKTSDIVRKR